MAEGGALLRRYTDKIRIEGSNPSLSARNFKGAFGPFFFGIFFAFCSPCSLVTLVLMVCFRSLLIEQNRVHYINHRRSMV